jgi:hypothetical protein
MHIWITAAIHGMSGEIDGLEGARARFYMLQKHSGKVGGPARGGGRIPQVATE